MTRLSCFEGISRFMHIKHKAHHTMARPAFTMVVSKFRWFGRWRAPRWAVGCLLTLNHLSLLRPLRHPGVPGFGQRRGENIHLPSDDFTNNNWRLTSYLGLDHVSRVFPLCLLLLLLLLRHISPSSDIHVVYKHGGDQQQHPAHSLSPHPQSALVRCDQIIHFHKVRPAPRHFRSRPRDNRSAPQRCCQLRRSTCEWHAKAPGLRRPACLDGRQVPSRCTYKHRQSKPFLLNMHHR